MLWFYSTYVNTHICSLTAMFWSESHAYLNIYISAVHCHALDFHTYIYLQLSFPLNHIYIYVCECLLSIIFAHMYSWISTACICISLTICVYIYQCPLVCPCYCLYMPVYAYMCCKLTDILLSFTYASIYVLMCQLICLSPHMHIHKHLCLLMPLFLWCPKCTCTIVLTVMLPVSICIRLHT